MCGYNQVNQVSVKNRKSRWVEPATALVWRAVWTSKPWCAWSARYAGGGIGESCEKYRMAEGMEEAGFLLPREGSHSGRGANIYALFRCYNEKAPPIFAVSTDQGPQLVILSFSASYIWCSMDIIPFLLFFGHFQCVTALAMHRSSSSLCGIFAFSIYRLLHQLCCGWGFEHHSQSVILKIIKS